MIIRKISNALPKRLLTTTLLLTAGFAAFANTINVYDADQLQNALKNAQPGDEIIVNPGNYVGEQYKSGNSKSHFFSDRSGTASDPIILRSRSTLNKQVLKGDDVNSAYIFYLKGDYWEIKDLKFSTAQKGIMLEGANHNVIDNVALWDLGAEAVHFRYFSSNNTLKNCYIHNTGKRKGKEGFGEAVYVGSHNGHTSSKFDPSNNNRIGGCSIGPNITGEAFDIKSGTKGTVIESNYMSAQGIIGTAASPAADSFIDIKGTDVIVRNNVMDWANDSNLDHAIFTYQEHRNSNIYNNQFRLSTSSPTYKLLEETVHAVDNIRLDGGSRLVQKDYQLEHIDDRLDQSIEQVAYSYTCFDELTNGCGTSPIEPTPPPVEPTPPPVEPTPPPVEPTPPPVEPTPPPANACTGIKDVEWNARVEISLAESNCIRFSNDLANERLQAWDSDENSSCNFRGEIESVSNPSISGVVDANYNGFRNFSGTTFKITSNNNCPYIKVRAY